jgi:hypothetical protein
VEVKAALLRMPPQDLPCDFLGDQKSNKLDLTQT